MTINIQVRLFRPIDIRIMNMFWETNGDRLKSCVRWEDSVLHFFGPSLDWIDACAIYFYDDLYKYGPCMHKIRARMRHRFGRNGHGWPPNSPSIDWSPLQDATRLIYTGVSPLSMK